MKKVLVILFLFIFSFPVFGNNNNNSNIYFEKIDNLVKTYKEASNSFTTENDNSFYKLQKYYEDIVFDMNTKNIDSISQLQCTNYRGKYLSIYDNRSNKINIQNYYNRGIGLYCSEAMSIFTVDYNWLKNHYGSGLSKAYRQWLKYLEKPVLFEEGMVNANKTAINKTIKNLKQFIHLYPQFVGIKDVKRELEKLNAAK